MEMERRIVSRLGLPGVRFPFFLFVLCAKIFKPIRQRGSVFFDFISLKRRGPPRIGSGVQSHLPTPSALESPKSLPTYAP